MSHRSMSRRGWCAAAAATALTATATVAASAPAGAAPGENRGNVLFREHFIDRTSHIEQEEHGDEFCSEVPFLVRFDGQATFTFTDKAKGRGDLIYVSFHTSQKNTWTNVETGASFHEQVSLTSTDQKLRVGDDGLLTIDIMDKIGWKLFDDNGKLVGVDAGLVRIQVVVDLHDPADFEDDEELSFEVLAEHGTRQLGERDFCADVMTFLG